MDWYLILPVVFTYTAILWVVVIFLYNLLFEPFDFGPLGLFAGKSALLVFIVTLTVSFVPFGGFAALIVWWVGLMVVFKRDFLECKLLVLLIWGTNFLFGLAVQALLMSGTRSLVSTV